MSLVDKISELNSKLKFNVISNSEEIGNINPEYGKIVYDSDKKTSYFGNKSQFVKLSQYEYDSLKEKDPNTIYIIYDECSSDLDLDHYVYPDNCPRCGAPVTGCKCEYCGGIINKIYNPKKIHDDHIDALTYTVPVINRIKSNPYTKPNRVLKYGSRGEDVKWLQQELINRGYDLKLDGIMGVDTSLTLRNFQNSANLIPDALCGVRTIDALCKFS